MKTELTFIIENGEGDRRFCAGPGTSQKEYNETIEGFTDKVLEMFKQDQRSVDVCIVELLVCDGGGKYYKTYASIQASEWLSEWREYLYRNGDNEKKYRARAKRITERLIDGRQVDMKVKKGWFR